MIELQKAAEMANEIVGTQWVQFVHISRGDTPCQICAALNGCCFVASKKPEHGDKNHQNCHCEYVKIPPITATVYADIRKFNQYLFIPEKSKGKTQMFLNWGYNIEDSEWLRQEFFRQAKTKYEAGEYRLWGDPDKYGQRINIQLLNLI